MRDATGGGRCDCARTDRPAAAFPDARRAAGNRPAAEPDWLLEGFIACGVLTVGPAGKPKVGKSTLALALVRAIRSDAGTFLGRRVRSTQVVYLSEESGSTLLHKLPADDPGLHLLTRENAWPRPPWADVVAAATEHALRVGAELLVADTWGFWSELPADREKDAGAVQGAVAPLLQATAQGLAVMLPTHTRKAGGEDGDAIRGSNALAGAGDIVLELERPTGENAPPRQRVLAALSRFPQTPPVLLIDHDAATDSWGVIGEGQDRRDTRAASDRAALLRLLPSDGPGLTRPELEAEMRAPHKQWAGTLHTLIEEGVAHQDGAGRKGDPYRYRLLRSDAAQPLAQHPRSKPSLSGAPRSGAPENRKHLAQHSGLRRKRPTPNPRRPRPRQRTRGRGRPERPSRRPRSHGMGRTAPRPPCRRHSRGDRMSAPRPAQPPDPFGAGKQANATGPVRLDAESVEAIAARVAELLRETPPPPLPKLVSARELARSLGVSRDWVYAHAEELGGVAIGSGDRPRLRFDPDAALSTWLAFSVSKGTQEREPAPKAQVSRRRKRRAMGTDLELLPIGGEKGRRKRPERSGDAVVE